MTRTDLDLRQLILYMTDTGVKKKKTCHGVSYFYNDMGGVGAQHVKWDEDFFEKVFGEACQCISAVAGHQKSLARFRAIAESLPANEQIPGGTEPKKFGETRYGSRVTMSERMIKTSRIYQLLMLDKEFVD
jgi:hypothetical protein